MATLALEQRRKPIGNTFLNVCEVESAEEAKFKREAVQLLPGGRRRRGHSISGTYIPFALQGGSRRKESGRHASARKYVSDTAAIANEAHTAQSPTGSASSPTGSVVAESTASGKQSPECWPDTDHESSSRSPRETATRSREKARTAPPEFFAKYCAELLRLNQEASHQGAQQFSATQQPSSSEPGHVCDDSQTKAPACLPSLLGRHTCTPSGGEHPVKTLFHHLKDHLSGKVDVKSQIQQEARPSEAGNTTSLPASGMQPMCPSNNVPGRQTEVVLSAPGQLTTGPPQQLIQHGPQASAPALQQLHPLPQLQPLPAVTPMTSVTPAPLDLRPAPAVAPMTPVSPMTSVAPMTPVTPMTPAPASPPGFFTTTMASPASQSCEDVEPETAQPKEEVTTLMIRNLPTSINQRDLVDDLDQCGFKGQYDFLYMPSCFESGEGKGFAFVNLVSATAAGALVGKWHKSRRFGINAGEPSLNLSPAAIQGFHANVKKWNAPRMRRVRNPNLRPYLPEDAIKAASTATTATTDSSRAGARKNGQVPDSQSSAAEPRAAVGTPGPLSFQPAARPSSKAGVDSVSSPEAHSGPQSSTSQCTTLATAPPAQGLQLQQATYNQAINNGLLQTRQVPEAPSRELHVPSFHQGHCAAASSLPTLQQGQSSGLLVAPQAVEANGHQLSPPNFNHVLNIGPVMHSNSGGHATCPAGQSQNSAARSNAGNNGLSLELALHMNGLPGTSSCSPNYSVQGMSPCAMPVALSTPPPYAAAYQPPFAPPSLPPRTVPAWSAVQASGIAPLADGSPQQMVSPHCQVPDYEMQVRDFNTPPFGFA